MRTTNLPLHQLKEAVWNSNRMDDASLGRLRRSVIRYGLVQNLVVRPLDDGGYEVLSGNQRLQVLMALGCTKAPCVLWT